MSTNNFEFGDQDRLNRSLQELILHSKIPGVSVAVNVNGEVLRSSAGAQDVVSRAELTVDDRFEAGYLGKFFIALAALDLVADGILDLDAPISSYLKELSGDIGDQISLRNLLSNTGGYQEENLADPDIARNYSWQEFATSFNRSRMLFRPGAVFSYSHSATVIISKIVERVSGEAIGEHVDQRVFRSLGISTVANGSRSSRGSVSGHFFHPEKRAFLRLAVNPCCDFWSPAFEGVPVTPSELSCIGAALIDASGTLGAVCKLLCNSVVSLPSLHGGVQCEELPSAAGLGCMQYPTATLGASSTAFGQSYALRMCPRRRIVIAVGINAHYAFIRDYLVNKLLCALLPKEESPEHARHMRVDTFELAELVGSFEGAKHNTFILTAEGNELFMRRGHNPVANYAKHEVGISFVRDELGRIIPRGRTEGLFLGFFREPDTRVPCLMVGSHAYKKTGGEQGSRLVIAATA